MTDAQNQSPPRRRRDETPEQRAARTAAAREASLLRANRLRAQRLVRELRDMEYGVWAGPGSHVEAMNGLLDVARAIGPITATRRQRKAS